ncbi:MAG: 3'(2'),5'-bisphosphate nucleotidase CysQ [Bacteroidia bacterium]|nr:3'(2'),5'-bisphosphate nucleotidase CysQ [Bacteroidia bacterium]
MNLRELLLLACRSSLEGGIKIMQVYRTDFEIEFKNDSSPLTLADRSSHDAIVARLAESKYPIISEEGKEDDYSTRKDYKRFWCVDPLDGTKEFVKKNGEFTVNIALIENNSPILGVIYIPVKDLLYASAEGLIFRIERATEKFTGAKFNLTDFVIPVSTHSKTDNHTRILASRSHLTEDTKKYIRELESQEQSIEFITAGSALKFCLLAEGNADIYPRFAPTMEWDTAAGHALLKAVGKNILCYPSGEELTYNKIKLVNDWFIAH